MSPADSFGTAIGVGIGVGIQLTNPISAKLPAERVATLSYAVTLGNVQRDGLRCAPTMRTGVDPSRYAVLSHARSRARPGRQTRWPHARRRASHDRMA
ncbi:MAG: hypothetical protein N838_30410 [Thiohalocapsa sp. PB-PSB1]|nr:MAG: hypothetical protein N838_30410 [Thiohalocapsa sp. PB-PSB1]